jgi:hypothetical protein
VWTAWSWDEDYFPDPVTIHDPKNGIYLTEDVNLFGERVFTVDEFQLLKQQLTNIAGKTNAKH